MASTPHKRAYFLPSNTEEKRRLVIQHELLLSATGGKHIHAPVDLNDVKSVLESGTGTGIWLEEVARQIPAAAELVGVDIESKLFPDIPTLPPYLSFKQKSVLELPCQWTNKFDLVHQRLLIAGLRNDEWRTALSEIFRVLKPGGWFQLFEIDEWEQSGPHLSKFHRAFALQSEARGIVGLWPNGAEKWQRYVEDAGFSDIRVTWHYSPMGKWAGEEGLRGKENMLWLMRGCKRNIAEGGAFGNLGSARDFDRLIEEVDKEFEVQQGTRNRYIMICGQKPSNSL